MAKIVTVADMPDELVEQWLMHLRVFDRMHPGCHFNAMADAEQALEQIRAICEKLELPEIAVYARKVKDRGGVH